MAGFIKKFTLTVAFVIVAGLGFNTTSVQAHCQLPCGIFDDHARVQAMLEDTFTIERSSRLIIELTGKTDPRSRNQLIRWVMTKEEHAQNIIATISDYFLAQRVKSNQKDYKERLVKHHEVMVAAMKAKQNTDSKYAEKLKETIEALLPYYPAHKH